MLSSLFNQVRDAITQHSADNQGNLNANGLIGEVEQLFNQHPLNNYNNNQGILPASQDPYGDPGLAGSYAPADRAAGILPASADPYGDPANQR